MEFSVFRPIICWSPTNRVLLYNYKNSENDAESSAYVKRDYNEKSSIWSCRARLNLGRGYPSLFRLTMIDRFHAIGRDKD